MTPTETELLKLINENDNPEQALMTAALIILADLKLHGSSGEASPAAL